MDVRLKVSVDTKGATEVSVNTALDKAYERLFQSALADLQSPAQTVDAAIRMIVFGCFWLEATCNRILEDLLEMGLEPEAAVAALWEITERSSFLSKLAVVSAFAKSPDVERVKGLLKELKQVFDLRNRLAHFKDKDTLVAQNPPLDELDQIFEEPPDPELLQRLKPPHPLAYGASISAGINWLKEVHQQYSYESPEDSFRGS